MRNATWLVRRRCQLLAGKSTTWKSSALLGFISQLVARITLQHGGFERGLYRLQCDGAGDSICSLFSTRKEKDSPTDR